MENNNEIKIIDFLNIFYKWRKMVIINVFILSTITIGIVLLIPNEYKASATVFYTKDNSSLLDLGSMLSSSNGAKAKIGAKVFGATGVSTEDMLLAILSRGSTIGHILTKFDLMKYYGREDGDMDKAAKALLNDFSFGPDDHGMLQISMINRDPVLAANIVNYLIPYLDSINIQLNVQQAVNNRDFLEKRYQKVVTDLKESEEILHKMQQKYHIFSIPAQFEAAVKMIAELEGRLMEAEIKLQYAKSNIGVESPLYVNTLAEVEALRRKLKEAKSDDNNSSKSDILAPYKIAPEIALEYMRRYREVDIQNKFLEIILPIYEQTKFDVQKSIPAILPLEKAAPPKLKEYPKRTFIILSVAFIALFLHMFLSVLGEYSLRSKDSNLELLQKMAKFAEKTKKFYRIKTA